MNDRPASYDRQLVEYLPLVRRLVNSQRPKNPDDMIQDVMLEAVRKWPLYSPDYKFGTWMVLMVRNVISARKQLTRVKKRQAVLCSLDAGGIFSIGTPAAQHDYVELSETLRRLSGTRDSDVLMRYAMGEELAVIGADYGIGKERARQLCERERGRLRRVAA
ncbi:RNA polymerase sigma factor (sigma-70 family) [Sinorhizobium fredii]